MSNETILVAVLTILSVPMIHLVHKTFVGHFKTVLRLDSTRIIGIIVVIVVNIPYFFDTGRVNDYELLRDGLSISNIINVVDSIVIAIVAVYLLAAAWRLKFNLVSGPSFWLVLLFALYFASATWSIFPQGSAFRALELAAYYVVAVFVFTGRQPLYDLYWMMFLQILLGAATLAPDGFAKLGAGQTVGFIESNQYSLYAAAFCLLHYHLYRSRFLGYLYGLFFLLGFGSVATLAAFLGGAVTYAVYGYASGPIHLMRVPITISMASICVLFIFFPEVFTGVIDFIAPLLQKDVHAFYNASGRIELWQFYYSYLRDLPFGSGFWSERVLFVHGFDVPWSAMNAHNGFLSAWIGAGIPALGCLLMVYISTIVNLRRQNVLVRRICFSLLFMLFINSMTYSGIGGFFSMWYFVLAAVIVLSNLEKSETTRVVGISLTIGQLGKSALQG